MASPGSSGTTRSRRTNPFEGPDPVFIRDLNILTRTYFFLVFREHNLRDHIDGSVDSRFKEDDEEWTSIDATLIRWFYTTISKDLFHTAVSANDDAHAVWTKLNDLFTDNALQRKVFLYGEFFGCQQLDSSVDDYCMRLKKFVDELRDLGEKVSDELLLSTLIAGLNDDFGNAASNIPLITNPTFPKIVAYLKLEERRMQMSRTRATHTALTAGTRGGAPPTAPAPRRGLPRAPSRRRPRPGFHTRSRRRPLRRPPPSSRSAVVAAISSNRLHTAGRRATSSRSSRRHPGRPPYPPAPLYGPSRAYGLPSAGGFAALPPQPLPSAPALPPAPWDPALLAALHTAPTPQQYTGGGDWYLRMLRLCPLPVTAARVLLLGRLPALRGLHPPGARDALGVPGPDHAVGLPRGRATSRVPCALLGVPCGLGGGGLFFVIAHRHPGLAAPLDDSLSGWHFSPEHALDVSNAFLHGHLAEQVFCEQPTGFVDAAHPDHVCLLSRSLYVLKQAPWAWYQCIAAFLQTLGFTSTRSDASLFVYDHGVDTAYLLLYIDDIILTASTAALLQRLTARLRDEFALKDLGPLHYFLGIEVVRRPDGFFLHQQRYTHELLDRAGMLNCKPAPTPVDTKAKVSALERSPASDAAFYCSIVGALQYLTLTRPDLQYAVQQVCLHMHAPRDSHWTLVKRILHDIRGTQSMGLTLTASASTDLVAYSDADWVGCPDTRCSTSGCCVYLGLSLISWSSKRQPIISRSSAEAEYRAVANTVAECSWLRQLLQELLCDVHKATLVYCDNVSAVYLSANPVHHRRTKHIELDIHFVREKVALGRFRVLHVPTA
nr:uncharacterized protein LOC109776374 [Aegilops tauschii subsp. strangulata]